MDASRNFEQRTDADDDAQLRSPSVLFLEEQSRLASGVRAVVFEQSVPVGTLRSDQEVFMWAYAVRAWRGSLAFLLFFPLFGSLTCFPVWGQELALEREWVAIFSDATGGATTDAACDIGLDTSGNVFVVGDVWEYAFRAYAVVKYSPEGTKLWDREEEVGLLSMPYSPRLAVDASNAVVIVGAILGEDEDLSDCFAVRYSSSGVRLATGRPNWSPTFEGITDVAVDSLGFIYFSGNYETSNTTDDAMVGKYNPDLTEVWSTPFHGADDYGFHVTTAEDGSVYNLASSTGYSHQDDIVLIKYSSAGVFQWSQPYNGGGSWSDDWPAGLVVDGDGNAYVMGYSEDSSECRHGIVTIKYSPAGVALWTRRYDYNPGSCDPPPEDQWAYYPAGLAVDGEGNVYCAGRSWGGDSGYDFVTLAYASDGDLLWSKRYDGAAGSDDELSDLGIDGYGRVWVTGSTCVDEYCGDYDYLTIVYSGGGTLLASDTYTGADWGRDQAHALVVDPATNAVYVTGTAFESFIDGSDFATIKYVFPDMIFTDGFESGSTSAWSP